MTATAEAVDAAPVEHLDEAWDIACEFELDDLSACGAHALWWFRCRSCGWPVAMCEAHRLEQIAAFQRWGGSIFCTRCGARGRPHRWRDHFSITPIEGRP